MQLNDGYPTVAEIVYGAKTGMECGAMDAYQNNIDKEPGM